MVQIGKLALLAAIATASMAVAGCVDRAFEYTLLIDPKFVETDTTEKVLAAAEDWELKVPVTFRPIIRPCSGIQSQVICVHYSSLAEVASKIHAPEHFAGVTEVNIFTDGGEVYIAMDWTKQTCVFGHEYGHAMGLQHHVGLNLMDPTCADNAATVAQENDIQQWWDLRGGR
jgi:hypothetical protein